MTSYLVTVWVKKGGNNTTYGLYDTLPQAKKAFEHFKKDSNTDKVVIAKVVEIYRG